MDEYYRIHRLVPRWAAALITIPVGIGMLGIGHAGFYDTLAGGPFFLILGYALLAGYLNSSWVRAGAHGIMGGIGPVPVSGPFEPVQPGDVAKVYVRHAWMPSRSGGGPYLAAGVQRRDGRWLDLSKPMLPDAEVRREAAAIARALRWRSEVDELYGMPPKADWAAGKPVLYWTGAVLAALVWGVFVETVLRH